MSVIIVGAIGTSLAVTLILVGVDEARTSLSVERSYRAKNLADSCAEKALDAIRLDKNYTGNETVSFGSDKCDILAVSNPGTETPVISSVGTSGTAKRKIQITVSQVTPKIKVLSWKDVADF